MWWEHGDTGQGRAAVVVAEDDVVPHDLTVIGDDVVVDLVRGRMRSWFSMGRRLKGLKAVCGSIGCI